MNQQSLVAADHALGLRLDDVVCFEDFGLTGVDADLLENGQKALAECVHLLLGVPDLADFEIAVACAGRERCSPSHPGSLVLHRQELQDARRTR